MNLKLLTAFCLALVGAQAVRAQGVQPAPAKDSLPPNKTYPFLGAGLHVGGLSTHRHATQNLYTLDLYLLPERRGFTLIPVFRLGALGDYDFGRGECSYMLIESGLAPAIRMRAFSLKLGTYFTHYYPYQSLDARIRPEAAGISGISFLPSLSTGHLFRRLEMEVRVGITHFGEAGLAGMRGHAYVRTAVGVNYHFLPLYKQDNRMKRMGF